MTPCHRTTQSIHTSHASRCPRAVGAIISAAAFALTAPPSLAAPPPAAAPSQAPQPAPSEPAPSEPAPSEPAPAPPAADAPAEPRWAPTLDADARRRIVDAVNTAAQRSRFRGGILVAIDGQPLIIGGEGPRIPGAPADSDGAKPIDEHSIFELASIAKPFTAIVILQIAREGRLDLDAPIESFFTAELAAPDPDLKVDLATSSARGVTIRQLLSHQSGLNNDDGISPYAEPSRHAMVRRFFGSSRLAEPGTRFDYNNAAYCLLAAIIEKVTNDTFENVMKARVFDKASMTSTGFPPGDTLSQSQRVRRKGNFAFHDHPWGWGYRGCGGILSTPADMLAFDRALADGTLLDADQLALMHAPGKPVGPRQPDATYALGWYVGQRDGMLRASHSGGSFGCRANFVRYPGQRVVIAAFSDDTANPFAITDAAEAAIVAEIASVRDNVSPKPASAP